MARTRLTVVELPKTYPGGEEEWSFEAADTSNQNDFLLTGREILLIDNANVAGQDVTISSVADPYGREGDLTVTVAATSTVALYFGARTGWMQADGALYLDTTSSDISYAVLRLPV
jgi:hypothetical protein